MGRWRRRIVDVAEVEAVDVAVLVAAAIVVEADVDAVAHGPALNKVELMKIALILLV